MKHQTRLITASLSTLFLLVGCQSTAKYSAKLDSWKGKTEKTLLAERGAPDQFFESDGIRYLTYNSSSDIRYLTYVNGQTRGVSCSSTDDRATGVISSTTCKQLYCKEVFKIEKNIIQGIEAEGNNCL